MTGRKKPCIATRKEPKQARSQQLVEKVLMAASRVLAAEGAHRFTAARVAEEASISVGSLYQYFPNKEAILFRLQSDEWEQTGELLARILGDKSMPPLDRLRVVVHEFVRSECEEAAMRGALSDAAPLYRDAPEARAHKQAGNQSARKFIREVLPHTSESERIAIADVCMMSLSAVGKQLSETNLSSSEVDLRADAMANMLCTYLESLGASERKLTK